MSAHLRQQWRVLASRVQQGVSPLDYHGNHPLRLYIEGEPIESKDQVRFSDPKLAAFVDFQVTSDVWISFIAVMPERRGQGLARQVIQALYDAYPDRGVHWGEMYDAAIGHLYKSFRESEPERTWGGKNYYAKVVATAGIETRVGEDNGIPVLHIEEDEWSGGYDAHRWAQQQWGTEPHELVLIETTYEDLPRSGQRYLPACMCGSSGGWGSYSNRIKAAEKFWMYHMKLEPWRTAKTAAMRGPVYRGYQVNLPPDLKELVERYSRPPMEESERDQYLKIGKAIVEWLQSAHPGGAYSDGLGLGRHWTENKRFADIATTHGNVSGNWPILLTAQYDDAAVDPNPTMTTKEWQRSEDEITLLPGARVTVTSVEFPDSFAEAWRGQNFLASPMEGRA